MYRLGYRLHRLMVIEFKLVSLQKTITRTSKQGLVFLSDTTLQSSCDNIVHLEKTNMQKVENFGNFMTQWCLAIHEVSSATFVVTSLHYITSAGKVLEWVKNVHQLTGTYHSKHNYHSQVECIKRNVLSNLL